MKKATAIVALLLLPVLAAGDDSPRLSAEVLWQLDRLDRPVIAPGGKHVVVQVTTYADDSDESESRLWLVSTSGEPTQRPLTAVGAKSSDAVFSPDGSRLAFISTRGDDEAGQIYVLPMDGPGEAIRLMEIPTGASALKWVGDHIYFISSVYPGKSFDEMAEILKTNKDSKVSAKVWSRMPYAYFDSWLDEARQKHVFRVPATGGDIESLTLGTGLQLSRSDAGASDYDVAPDGKSLAFVANSRNESVYDNPDVFLMAIGGTNSRNITDGNAAPDTNPSFSPDGKLLAFSRRQIAGFYGDQAKLMMYDLKSGQTRALYSNWDRSVDSRAWSPDSKGLYGAIDDAATSRLYYLPVNGGAPSPLTNDTDFDQPAIAIDGTLVARNQSFVYPPRIVRVDPKKKTSRRLDTFNDAELENVQLGAYESVTYTGADGDEIQMWVHYPPGFDPAKKYPLFLLIHGGPHGAITDNFHFRWNAQTFASWGYVTAWPNFHGSSGFGQAFTDSINPDWITRPYADTIAATEWLMQKPWIDTQRMVAGGGSYGGYLSTILLGREHPFNALVIHAAVYDLYSQNSADFAVHDERFGPYWENPELYRELSPHTYASKFVTPSLVIHGQLDLRVPVGQAFELFRALQTRGVESRLVYYPDENHWVLKRHNSLHWYGEVRNWVERFAAPGPIAQ
ncbi:MAG: S9 family peptidase [Gammaproteobacteria bacterium]|nr:S9 family peptidase [Gammaproteobacteria bacterium]